MLYSTVYGNAIFCLAVNDHLGISQWPNFFFFFTMFYYLRWELRSTDHANGGKWLLWSQIENTSGIVVISNKQNTN